MCCGVICCLMLSLCVVPCVRALCCHVNPDENENDKITIVNSNNVVVAVQGANVDDPLELIKESARNEVTDAYE